jgi:hypothetical protein
MHIRNKIEDHGAQIKHISCLRDPGAQHLRSRVTAVVRAQKKLQRIIIADSARNRIITVLGRVA